ncbi:hypothetical protein PTKIN_Ptkin15bG0059900 [Pterospermum kingtungense]
MYLAAIADAQPQTTPTMPPQLAPHPAMQPGGYFMQHPQAAAITQQSGIFPQKVPLQFNNPHQMQDPQQLHQQHQQAMLGQMGIRPGGPSNGMHPMHAEATLGGGSSGSPSAASGQNEGRGGNKKESSEAGADAQGNTTAGHAGGDGAEEAK